MKNKILVLFAHPAFEKSRVNRTLTKNLQRIEGITFHDLYEAYPDFDIDIKREQQLLSSHELIVFHHPFYWYSSPSIIKEYLDLVLEHGWAYGHEGHALEGKYLMHVITTGAKEETYCAQGRNHYTIEQLLTPMEQTASMCNLNYIPPYMVYGSFSIEQQKIEEHREQLENFYRKFLIGILDIKKFEGQCDINTVLKPKTK